MPKEGKAPNLAVAMNALPNAACPANQKRSLQQTGYGINRKEQLQILPAQGYAMHGPIRQSVTYGREKQHTEYTDSERKCRVHSAKDTLHAATSKGLTEYGGSNILRGHCEIDVAI